MEYLSTKEIATITGCSIKTAQRWAVKNNVKSEGVGARKTFFWTKENLEHFKNRNKKAGRPRKETENYIIKKHNLAILIVNSNL